MLKKISSFWIIFIVLIITNILAMTYVYYRITNTALEEVEEAQFQQLTALASAEAKAIDNQLREFEASTLLAGAYAQRMLLEDVPLDEAEEAQRLEKYKYTNNIWGLDDWYKEVYYPEYGDELRSNVYILNEPQLSDRLEYLMAVTEDLDPVFESVMARQINTQWIYLTTREGMMRIYPWAGNSGYGPNWYPQEQKFYTVTVPGPRDATINLDPVWTAPYVDCADAGLMVTNSMPLYDRENRRLLGVMSHDFLIRDLQTDVLNFKVGDPSLIANENLHGYAFLLDDDGDIIAHKDYQLKDEEITEEMKCRPIERPLIDYEPNLESVVEDMLAQRMEVVEFSSLVDGDAVQWIITHDTIPTTNWHLAMALTYDEAVKPATDIQREVLLITLALIIFSIPVSAAAARLISQPIFRLSETAQQIEESVEKDNRAALQNMRLPSITGTAEVSQLISVFGQMVGALLNRMRELDTIYAIGQTITANLDHEAAMQSVLDAVRDVVDYDAAEIAIIEGDQLTVYAWNGKRGFKNTVGNKYKVGVGITGKMAETKKSVYIPTITEEESDTSRRTLASSFMSTEMIGRSERVMINSYLGIPLLVKDEVIGVLTMVHHEPNHFTEDDQRQINKLSAQASIAIYNSLRVRAREDELKNRIRELQIHVSDAQNSRESETLMNAQYFQSLREQARKLRLRRKKGTGEDTEVTLVE